MKLIKFFLIIFIAIFDSHTYNIGLCIMATGKYLEYANRLITSAKKYFMPGHNVTYFVFTDQPYTIIENVVFIYQKRLGWPYDTLQRFHVYAQNLDQMQHCDYIFATDADMLFVDYVKDEILGNCVATQHPGFVGKLGSYETRAASKAYVDVSRAKHYFAGGFYGGSFNGFSNIISTCVDNIDIDIKNNTMAIWHDESHLNKYFIDNPPTVILSPSYCYPERWNLPYKKKLLALDKNHTDMRK